MVQGIFVLGLFWERRTFGEKPSEFECASVDVLI